MNRHLLSKVPIRQSNFLLIKLSSRFSTTFLTINRRVKSHDRSSNGKIFNRIVLDFFDYTNPTYILQRTDLREPTDSVVAL